MGKGNWLNLAHEKNLEMCSANTEAVPRIERKSYRSIDPGSWNWPWIWRAGTWKKMKKKGPGIRFSNFKGLERAVESIINGNPVIIFSNIQSSNPVIIFSRCNTVRVALTMSFFSPLIVWCIEFKPKTNPWIWTTAKEDSKHPLKRWSLPAKKHSTPAELHAMQCNRFDWFFIFFQK